MSSLDRDHVLIHSGSKLSIPPNGHLHQTFQSGLESPIKDKVDINLFIKDPKK